MKDGNFELVTKEIFGPFQVWKGTLRTLNKVFICFLKKIIIVILLCSFCEIKVFYLYFQVITDYKNSQLSVILDAMERMHKHLTAAVVSSDSLFLPARLFITQIINF